MGYLPILQDSTAGTRPSTLPLLTLSPSLPTNSFLATPGARRIIASPHKSREGAFHVTAHQRRRAELHREDDARHHRFPQLDRRRLGSAVLASEGLHAGVHH